MWLNNNSCGLLFEVLLLLHYNVVPTRAANIAQMKNHQQQQQQTVEQASTTSLQHQQHSHLVHSQTQHQLHQSPQQQHHNPTSSSIAAHPTNGISSNSANKVLHDSNGKAQGIPPSLPSSSSLPPAQYVVNDKEAAMQEVLEHFNTDDDLNDQYQILDELKRESHVNAYHGPPQPPPLPTSAATSSANSMSYPWNLYAPNSLPPPPLSGLFSQMFNPFETFPTPFPVTPRFMPIVSYPQPVFVPYPFIMSPEMYYPSYATLPHLANDYDDSMSRGAGSSRRPISSQHPSTFPRNSPIYYVRLPPTPYMFLPSLGLGSTPTTMSGYPTMLPYQSLPSFPSFSSIFNVPINFLANGKPSNIYQMSAPPNDIQNSLQFANVPSSFNTRPPPPPPPNAYRPAASSHNFLGAQSPSTSSLNYGSYPGSTTSSSQSSTSSSSHQDSKLTALKRPYYFNGRPEDIYILPNNFNSLYSSESSYY